MDADKRTYICAHCSRDMREYYHERCSNGGICVSIEEFDEKLVRDSWERVEELDPCTVRITVSNAESPCFCGFKAKWSSAAAFTRAHKAKVAEVEQEIGVVRGLISDAEADGAITTSAVLKRILARERATLAELKRGLKS